MANSEASQQANRSGMTAMRLLVIFFLLGGIVTAMFLGQVLGAIWAHFGWSDPVPVEGLDWHITTIVGVLLAAGIVAGSWLHLPTRQLLLECASELMKVTWPSWSETRISTVAVVVASVVSAFVLFGIDTFSYKLMVVWLPALWGKL